MCAWFESTSCTSTSLPSPDPYPVPVWGHLCACELFIINGDWRIEVGTLIVVLRNQSRDDILAEELIEAAVTVWLVVLLLERALVQLLQAEGAHKVLRMELLEHGRNAASGDRFRAASAQGTAFGVIMRLTVWKSLVVEEGTALERLTAVLRAREIECKDKLEKAIF